jgi:hypothetical protein
MRAVAAVSVVCFAYVAIYGASGAHRERATADTRDLVMVATFILSWVALVVDVLVGCTK